MLNERHIYMSCDERLFNLWKYILNLFLYETEIWIIEACKYLNLYSEKIV